MVYDEAGRTIQQTNGNYETTRYTYDLRGNVVATTQPMGQVNKAAFDANGHQIANLDAIGSLATWSYDAFGELTEQNGHTDIGGASYGYSYDNARQLIAQTNSRGQNLAYAYDAAGQLVQIRDNATDQTTRYAYNSAGKRVLEQTVQGGATYQNQTLAYDTLGRLSRVDALSALDGATVLFEYDKVGNRLHQKTTYATQEQRQETPPQTGAWYTADGNGGSVRVADDDPKRPQFDGTDDGYAATVDGGTGYTTFYWYWDAPLASYTVYDVTAHNEDLWYAYDEMNRQILVDGAYNGNAADLANVTSGQGHIVTYDKNGNRTSDTTWGEQVVVQQPPPTGGWYHDVTDPDSGDTYSVEAGQGDPQPSRPGAEGEVEVITSPGPDGWDVSVAYTWHFDAPVVQYVLTRVPSPSSTSMTS
jgi:YD repeat-containing protein